AYPAQLQRLLEQSAGPGACRVRSFGLGGATAAATPGKKCYAASQRCADAVGSAAHTYVVMLGTNDAWHRSGEPERVPEGILALLELLRPAAAGARGAEDPLDIRAGAPGRQPARRGAPRAAEARVRGGPGAGGARAGRGGLPAGPRAPLAARSGAGGAGRPRGAGTLEAEEAGL
ncbi:unnamed protein product, partial [Prorocentrum cordatum]